MADIELSENYLADRVSLLKKLNAVRMDVLSMDWKPDKAYAVKGTPVPYVSLSKMKAQISPALARNGLELFIVFGRPEKLDPLDRMSQHWMIKLTVTLMDVDTGFAMYDEVYGEAGDLGDKGIGKAESYALKQWMSVKFMIADGIDPEDEREDTPMTFVRRTKEEEEEVKSKVLSQAMKVPAPADQTPAPKEAPKKPSKAPEPKEVSKPEEEPVVAPEPEEAPSEAEDAPAPADAPEPNPPNHDPVSKPQFKEGFKPEGPQAKAIDRITQEWKKRFDEGQVSEESYAEMTRACEDIASPADAVAFIKRFRVG